MAPGIPPILFSTQTERPFEVCIDCGGNLIESGAPYGVEKVIRNGEVIFEYAICTGCTRILLQEFSEESLKRISEYLREEGAILLSGGDPDHCHRCGRAREEFQAEHTVSALLIGDQLLSGVSTLCAACTEGIESVLSKKTREVHEDFITRNFPGVPANLDIPVGAFTF